MQLKMSISLFRLEPIFKRIYMRRKRQEMSEGTSQLDPTRRKPEGKVSVVRKFSPPKSPGNGHGASDGEDQNPKRSVRGGLETRGVRDQC